MDHWLKNYPQESILFIKLTLVNILIDTLSNPLMMGLQATGKIKAYQAIVGLLIFLNLPISYLLIRVTKHPEFVFITSIIISSLAIWLRLYFLKKNMGMNIELFLKEVILKVVVLSLIMSILFLLVGKIQIDNQWIFFFVKSILLLLSTVFFVYYILFNKTEKHNIKTLAFEKLKRKR